MAKTKKTPVRDYFWSGNTLMSSNNNGTFSSSHILQVDTSVIKLDDYDRKLIEAAPDMYKQLKDTQLLLMEIIKGSHTTSLITEQLIDTNRVLKKLR